MEIRKFRLNYFLIWVDTEKTWVTCHTWHPPAESCLTPCIHLYYWQLIFGVVKTRQRKHSSANRTIWGLYEFSPPGSSRQYKAIHSFNHQHHLQERAPPSPRPFWCWVPWAAKAGLYLCTFLIRFNSWCTNVKGGNGRMLYQQKLFAGNLE